MIPSAIKNHLLSIKARDPSVRTLWEIFFTFPGYHAVLWHRLNHALWMCNMHFSGRMLAMFSRWLTGIEIHPGAKIGKNLFIDHGLGLVIGETVHIGNNVTIYQGVTLGGTSPSVDSDSQRQKKRHPTIRDGAIIGAGAKILGPVEVGRHARVGANCVLTINVPDNTTAVAPRSQEIPAKDKAKSRKITKASFAPYGMPVGGWATAYDRKLDEITEELARLKSDNAALSKQSGKRSITRADK